MYINLWGFFFWGGGGNPEKYFFSFPNVSNIDDFRQK